jgi:hypothetical protein
MITRLPALVVALLCVSPLWAQVPIGSAADPENQQITWEDYQRNKGATRLGFELRMIATGEHSVPAPAELSQLIARGLASGDVDSREAALIAITTRAGWLRPPTPENVAMWSAYRDVLRAFRKEVEAALYDGDVLMRSSALGALTSLNMRSGKDGWVVDLDDDAVRTGVNLFHQDPSPGIRAEIINLFSLCECRQEILEARKQIMREGLYDTDPGVQRYAIRGAAELKIPDALEYIVHRLKDSDDILRSDAATAMQQYGGEAARYVPEIRAALADETDPDIRGILQAALQMILEQ